MKKEKVSKMEEFMNGRRKMYGDRFDPSDLSGQFVRAYNSQDRIEVVMADGEVRRGTVGVTTGWKPVFILMLRKDSVSSPYLLTDRDRIIRKIRRK